MFFFDTIVNPYVKEISYSQVSYFENGVWKMRHVFDTPAGTVSSVVGRNPGLELVTSSVYEPFIKERKDWRVINYLFRRMTEEMRPNYREIEMDQQDLGESGTTIGVVDRSPFQRVWIELSDLEEGVYAFADGEEEFQEFLEIQNSFHKKAAEITAGCPTNHIELIDNITNTISPELYREYCMPVYELYACAFEGSGKRLAVHHDGLMAHIKAEIAESPFDIIDSLTVPPVGNVSLSQAKQWWPDKLIFVNLPPHLAHSGEKEIREGYEAILEEWGSAALVIEHVEDMPEETLELHLRTVLDVSGYPS
jgi:hypothetical protein